MSACRNTSRKWSSETGKGRGRQKEIKRGFLGIRKAWGGEQESRAEWTDLMYAVGMCMHGNAPVYSINMQNSCTLIRTYFNFKNKNDR